MQTVADMRGVGVKNRENFADVLCGWPLIAISSCKLVISAEWLAIPACKLVISAEWLAIVSKSHNCSDFTGSPIAI
jgi:hypothetical protein